MKNKTKRPSPVTKVNPLDKYDVIADFGHCNTPLALAFSPKNELVVFRGRETPEPITLKKSLVWYGSHQYESSTAMIDGAATERWMQLIADNMP